MTIATQANYGMQRARERAPLMPDRRPTRSKSRRRLSGSDAARLVALSVASDAVIALQWRAGS